jgi:RNA polymerase sigma factor for flagellar operon FliA
MKMYQQSRPQGEELVLAHLGLVKRVALHLKARVPAFMELDELIQVGMMGLLEASRVFDASKGVDFENFAHSRVRGAMLDEVRRLSFLPRSAVALYFPVTDAETESSVRVGFVEEGEKESVPPVQ